MNRKNYIEIVVLGNEGQETFWVPKTSVENRKGKLHHVTVSCRDNENPRIFGMYQDKSCIWCEDAIETRLEIDGTCITKRVKV